MKYQTEALYPSWAISPGLGAQEMSDEQQLCSLQHAAMQPPVLASAKHKLETIHELGGKFLLQMSFGFTAHYIAQWEIELVVHMNIYCNE